MGFRSFDFDDGRRRRFRRRFDIDLFFKFPFGKFPFGKGKFPFFKRPFGRHF